MSQKRTIKRQRNDEIMNQETRDEIEKLKERFEEILSDEQEKLESMTEYFPTAERTEMQEETVSDLEDVISTLERIIE